MYSAETLMVEPEQLKFPDAGVMPKQETGASVFVEKYPEYNGKGVLVAVMDAGCDPTAEGLTTTPDGKVKFVDVIDATGSGDVDTSKIVKVDENGIIVGLSGRKLKPNKQWTNPSKEYHIGIIPAYYFYSKQAKPRLEKERTKIFNELQGKALGKLRQEILELEKEKNGKDVVGGGGDDGDKVDRKRILQEKIDDLKIIIAEMGGITNEKIGPVFDVVTWYDGKEWLAVLDTTSAEEYFQSSKNEKNEVANTNIEQKEEHINQDIVDLSSCKVMTNYRVRQEYDYVSKNDLLVYVLNIYDNGNLVSIVVPASSHGTHVAGIIGGYFPNDPSRNGAAPGCQMISIKIGDTRLGTMETNQGLMRALGYVKEWKCDLVNMSYGEPTTYPLSGAFPRAVARLVWEHGVIFVSSAGNDGPALSTSGAPKSSTDAILGIGAICTPIMVKAEYGLADIPGTNNYTWSSRGPTLDGAMGVKLCAPGGAISPIPKYTLSKNQLMNGTSMSSPNACGNVALLLSALKQLDIPYTPSGIEHALINTAAHVPTTETLGQGYGLLQVHKAFDYCVKFKEVISSPIHFRIRVTGGMQKKGRGIYIRDIIPSKVVRYSITVTPQFPESYLNEDKVRYELKCALKCNSPYITPCENLVIASQGNSFQVIVKIPQSSDTDEPVIVTEIVGFDVNNPQGGPAFRIPVVICVPVLSGNSIIERIGEYPREVKYRTQFTTGKIDRKIYVVPEGCSHAKITYNCIETKEDKELSFLFASFWKNGFQPMTYDSYLRVKTGGKASFTIGARSGTYLEITLAQREMAVGTALIECHLEFIGPSIMNNAVEINQGDQFDKVVLHSSYPCTLQPSIKFDTFSRYVSPQSSEIVPLSTSRGDMTLNNEQVYGLNLEYKFNQPLEGVVIPRFPTVDNLLYESVVEGTFWQLYDSNKKFIASGEAFEQTPKLQKQDGYVIQLQLRYPLVSFLKKLTTLQLRLDTKLAKPLFGEVYSNRIALLNGRKKVNRITMGQYQSMEILVTAPKENPVKSLQVGDHLRGWFYTGNEDKLEIRFRRNGLQGVRSLGIPAVCTLVELKEEDKKSGDSREKEEREKLSMKEQERDILIKWIQKLSGKEQLEALESTGEELLKKYPNHLPLLQLKLQVYDKAKPRKDYLKQVISLADELIAQIDTKEVAAFFGKKTIDKQDAQSKKLAKKCKEEKGMIVDALTRKAQALKELFSGEEGEGKNGDEKAKEEKTSEPNALSASSSSMADASFIEAVKNKGEVQILPPSIRIDESQLKEFESVWNELRSWHDIEKDKSNKDLYLSLTLWYLQCKNLKGEIIQAINKHINSLVKESSVAIDKKSTELKYQLFQRYFGDNPDWKHVLDQLQLQLLVDYPTSYRMF